MIRPALFSTSRQQRAVGRNLALDTVASIGVGVTAALVTTLLPTIARRGGLEPIGLAALAAAPFIANLLGAFAGQIGPRSRNQLALIRAGGAASLLLLAVFASAPVMIAVSIVFWLSLSLSGPYYLRLWGTMYPPRILGRVVGLPRLRAGRRRGHRGPGRRVARRQARRRDCRRAGWPGRARLRGRVRGPPLARHRTPAVVLAARFIPRPADEPDPQPGRPRPGLLRWRADRRRPALRDRQRRPPGPLPLRRRHHRDPDRRRDDLLVPALGRRRRTGSGR